MSLDLDRIVETIRARVSVRTPELAQAFDTTEGAIARALWPLCAPGGPLISCVVETAGRRMKEYRCSTIGGGKLKEIGYSGAARAQPKKTAEPFGNPKDIASALNARFTPPPGQNRPVQSPEPAAKPALAETQRKETAPVTNADRIIKALEKHGPMTTAQLREHVDYEFLSTVVGQLARKGRIWRSAVLGRGAVYGLEGQKEPDAGVAAAQKRAVRMVPLNRAASKHPFDLSEARMRELMASALRGSGFQLSAEETKSLALAALSPGGEA